MNAPEPKLILYYVAKIMKLEHLSFVRVHTQSARQIKVQIIAHDGQKCCESVGDGHFNIKIFIKISEQVPFTLSIINKQRNSEAGSLSEIRHYKVNVEIIKKGSRWLHFCRLRRMKRITKFRVDRSNRYV